MSIAQVIKVYLCLFVCFATKAVHIEIASDLTKETFLGALTRLVAHRGAPPNLHMDKATYFIDAQNQLNTIVKNIL